MVDCKKKSVFEYVVFYTPDNNVDNLTAPFDAAHIVVKPTVCVAATDGDVRVVAARSIPATYESYLDRCEVAVRTFCR